MLDSIDLAGTWDFQLDERKSGLQLPFGDTMELPGTTSYARKGARNEAAEAGTLTDEYRFEGWAWFSREFEIPDPMAGSNVFLYLERTRMTTVWIDGREAGTRDSLSTAHVYDLSALLSPGRHTITIRVDNTGYPTKGGHLTSPDTQTNWNGITGRIELRFFNASYLNGVQVYPDVSDRSFTIQTRVIGQGGHALTVSAAGFNGEVEHVAEKREYPLASADKMAPAAGVGDGAKTWGDPQDDGQEIAVKYDLGPEARLWSEAEPYLYRLTVRLRGATGETLDEQQLVVGLREFLADGDKFAINGKRTFLRGKHDGLVFPLTGFAPTTVDEWLRILGIAKSYGINHYRFHTCCPPEAAFVAADRLGIYMEPELPFWGTVTDESDPNHKPEEQNYLIAEGFAMLEAYGNHPSFVMFSLGNELWGSKSRLDAILRSYKAFDSRHLYVQGSNNFQFTPVILPSDDFFSGVRLSRERLLRGSYAMCDAPLGHVQTDLPGTRTDYDEVLRPSRDTAGEAGRPSANGAIQIQYGTGTKTVEAEAVEQALVPEIPVVTHEIGQYAMYPRYSEIDKYTGPLKARNLETFRRRLEEKGMGAMADRFFTSSGRLAVACYKEELEAAFRSRRLAGFQLLDLQDFQGQGTALVGILDAFMDSKGLVTPEEWRSFCSDAVLLARFDKYNYLSEERFEAHIELAYYRDVPLGALNLTWRMSASGRELAGGSFLTQATDDDSSIDIADLSMKLPAVDAMTKVVFELELTGTDIRKAYDIWLYPDVADCGLTGIHWAESLSEDVLRLLDEGENVLLMPKPSHRLSQSIEGTYCTDFWCYPMFRSISESMNKAVPIGTLGLCIDPDHPALAAFPSESHSTYPWWSLVSHSRSLILDGLPSTLEPIVWTVDNFERNHKLGFLFECRVRSGNLLVCALDAEAVCDSPEGKQFLASLVSYVRSDAFQPQVEVAEADLRAIL